MISLICKVCPLAGHGKNTLPPRQKPGVRLPMQRPALLSFSYATRQHRRIRRAAEGQDGRILILGGGIIGVSVAYHLALRGKRTLVVDHAGIASCASGKAGGFLARDWNDQGPLRELSRKSFDMHAKIAQTLGLHSYRRLSCKSVTVAGATSKPSVRKLEGLEWVDGASSHRQMGTESTIAQVHPKELTDAMWDSAQKGGAKFLQGTVNELISETSSNGSVVKGALVDGRELLAERVVLCLGPWAQILGHHLPKLRMYGQKCHSVLLQTQSQLKSLFSIVVGGNKGDNSVQDFVQP
eukprot:TRINITY_DN29859_c0_g1_i1.p1 TRINITY_DN29859_c0_g1~~TRINITY_DN29859_c0_g1_i1.p1  ORF type:complete len:296 (-),score=25.76 TRINITY_DN29859_c0_g1_i1:191-1078(-)